MQENIASVIQCNMSNDIFVMKYPEENFYTGSQLIVDASQKAVFYMNGETLDIFGPGRHTLTTQNMPHVSKFFNRITGDKTPFSCKVYFVNETRHEIKWGLSSPMQCMDPNWNVAFPVRAHGNMFLKMTDIVLVLKELVGTEPYLSQHDYDHKMKDFVVQAIRSWAPEIITEYLKEEKRYIFDLERKTLGVLSEKVKAQLVPVFERYGVELYDFAFTGLQPIEEDENYKRFKKIYDDTKYLEKEQEWAIESQKKELIEAETQAKKDVMAAQARAAGRALEGYTYQDERRFDVAATFAANEATGQMANVGIGLGMISGIGGAVGNGIGGMVGGALGQTSAGFTAGANAANANAAGVAGGAMIKCEGCGAEIAANAKFCPECGAKNQPRVAETIVCPGCGMTVSKKKFCPECGQLLAEPVCPDCGAKVAANAKFCPECGKKMN